MDEKELEKTKPIEILDDLYESRQEKFSQEMEANVSREEKYKQSLENQERTLSEEAAEEALAEKNIALAESYLQEEKAQQNSEQPPEKKKLIDKIKDKWSNLEKKQKIMVIVIALLLLVLLVLLIVFICKPKDVEDEKVNNIPEEKEEAPTIVDNFYYKEGNLYFINDSEEEIGSYECENKDANLCYVAFNDERDGFDVPKLEDTTGKEKIQRMPIFEDKYVFIVDNKDEKDSTLKLYAIKDEKVTNSYKTAKAYDDNYVIVSDSNNKHGLIEFKAGINELIKPEYESLRMINNSENLVAKNKKNTIIINRKNKVLSSTFDTSFDIRNYNENFVVAYVGGTYNLYDYKANLLASGYDYIAISDKYAALVDSEKKVYIIDNEKNKYNEGNVILKNKDYVKTYIYEESGELKEIKRSFEMNVKESAIEIAIYNGDEDVKYSNIEFTEGLINKKFKYVNYFDGKLYFYKDEEKAENIGVYECTNKNYVKSENDNYDYCFVAVDTIYEDNDMTAGNRNTMIPLINEKYVFVTDGPNTIKLYDLDSDKVLGTYTSVDTNLPSNNKEINKYNGKLEVIALNKKGKYGVLSIDGKSVEAKYSFEYNHLEKLGEYYLAQDADNKWKILYGKDKTSASVANKIRGYNSSLTYIKVKSGSGYAVYSETGEMTSDETYEYVELYKDFYAAVDKDKNIYVYDYQGRKLTDIAVKASSTDYGNLEYPAFKVEQNKTMFNISVFDGTKYTVTAVAEVSAGSEAGEVVEES